MNMWRLIRPDAEQTLHDETCRRSLPRYFGAFQDRRRAKFLISKRLEADFQEDESTEDLWGKHSSLNEPYLELERGIDDGLVKFDSLPTPRASYLDLKIEIARRIMGRCHLCERRCGKNRLKGEVGVCEAGSEMRVNSMFTHTGEEACLVPSFTIFTIHCNLFCAHCQNWSLSRGMDVGDFYAPEDLAVHIDGARAQGNRNANLVGGDPTPWLWHWLRVFKHVKANIPIVWNSNSYFSEEVARLLMGFSDVWLTDIKYGNDECAERISNAPRYWDVATRNHLMAKGQVEFLIRVLVLPGHLECCTKPILNWISENLGPATRVNVMFQYRPEYNASKFPELKRRLSAEERERAKEIAKESNLLSLEPWQE